MRQMEFEAFRAASSSARLTDENEERRRGNVNVSVKHQCTERIYCRREVFRKRVWKLIRGKVKVNIDLYSASS